MNNPSLLKKTPMTVALAVSMLLAGASVPSMAQAVDGTTGTDGTGVTTGEETCEGGIGGAGGIAGTDNGRRHWRRRRQRR